jgi:hypothetical protein
VTKNCTNASAPGQPINFSGIVTNTGNVTLNNVTVVDDHAGTVLTLASLAPGASAPYSGSYVPASSPSTNIVTASGTDAINGGTVTATARATCEILGGEGCTPGYWKQPQHFDSWTAPYAPNQQFSLYFENAFPGMTLLQVLQQGGGGLNALGRHTVSALLNAASPDVSYAFSPAQVISAFNSVFPGTDAQYEALKNRFATENERLCPLN